MADTWVMPLPIVPAPQMQIELIVDISKYKYYGEGCNIECRSKPNRFSFQDTYILSTCPIMGILQNILVVSLSMQKSFEQLDLFGFPVEPAPQPKKKEPVAKVAKVVIEEAAPAEPLPVNIVVNEIAPQKVSKKNTVSKTASKRGRKSFREMDSEADLIDVPAVEILEQKLYYSISEVAGWFKVNTSLLRFWENEFDILQPRKTRKGDRLFRVEDIKNLQLIYFLLRQRKFSIDGAKNYLKNNKQEADTQAQLVQSLTKFKSFLLELKSNLAN
jgi:DNA-binding transcriptional MerR regulator